ncbi:MAG: hypothetical protein CVV27_05895 [Candidatus Melainabacteria bacterium HGW-Melainabacteria-1]|nr:MAG: hypothetical protein CVV27_05895 [Candidatus Melainabacteria bacterium HGW-Melainabacteria-1]
MNSSFLDPISSSEGFWLQYGDACRRRGQLEVAEQAYLQALQSEAESWQAWYRLGLLRADLLRFDEAIENLLQAHRLQPDHVDILYQLGKSCHDAFCLDDAVHWYRQALSRAPEHIDSWFALAKTLDYLNQPQAARDCCRQVIALAAANPDRLDRWRINAELCLKLLDAADGTSAHPGDNPPVDRNLIPRDLTQPALRTWELLAQLHRQPKSRYVVPGAQDWDGEIRPHSELVVIAKNGLGDVIQILRFLPDLLSHGQPCLLWLPVHKGIKRLIKAVSGSLRVIESDEAGPERADFYVPHLDLPLSSRFASQSLSRVPYLFPHAGPEHALPGSRPKVGIVWACRQGLTRSKHWSYRQRSPGLAPFVTLIRKHPEMDFYSLQVGPDAHQLAQFPDLALTDLSPRIQDLYDTACLIQQLDLVISVDTAVAHLAGALGKPLWLLLPSGCDPRWGQANSTPWYPTARLFRQQTLLDWEAVFNTMGCADRSLRSLPDMRSMDTMGCADRSLRSLPDMRSMDEDED